MWILLVSFVLLATAPAVTAPSTPSDAQAPIVSTPTSASETAMTINDPLQTQRVIDTMLPCGVRVVVARDRSLPVVAVTLAVDVGSKDDPPELPGLVHALMYQVLQGNRELSPGESIRVVHDAGGVTMLGFGAGQVRFESLSPSSHLGELLWSEAQRLRAPTASPILWQHSIAAARRDIAKPKLSPALVSAVHGDVAGLAHDGRVVGPGLPSMVEGAIAAQLADKFGYELATLIVVGAADVVTTFEQVREAFADVPKAVARTRMREIPAGGRTLTLPGFKGSALAWPIPPAGNARLWARTLCRALNRQTRGVLEPRQSRIRCTLDEDPHRGVLMVRTVGVDDPVAAIEQRITRLVGTSESWLLQREADQVVAALRREIDGPVGLARWLAQVMPIRSAADRSDQPDGSKATNGPGEDMTLYEISGLSAFAAGRENAAHAINAWFSLETAIRLISPSSP